MKHYENQHTWYLSGLTHVGKEEEEDEEEEKFNAYIQPAVAFELKSFFSRTNLSCLALSRDFPSANLPRLVGKDPSGR